MMHKSLLAATLAAVMGTSLAEPVRVARFGGFHALGGARGFGGVHTFRGFGVRGAHYGAYSGGAYAGHGYDGGGYYRGYGAALAAGRVGAAAGASVGAAAASPSYYYAPPSTVCVTPAGSYHAC